MENKIRFMNLSIEDSKLRKELLQAVDAVFQHGWIIEGPEVQELEQEIARYCGRQYAVGVNSGTDALFLGLKSLGIGIGDEVITSAMSWIATANAITLTGAKPVFADIREDLNIDPDSIRKLITPQTKAIIPVHYTGKICAMHSIMHLADEHHLHVIEDAAQAFGATYKGQRAGSFGTIGCFSMNPMKVYSACGEAGMVVTDKQEIADRLIALRHNGTVNGEVCLEPSLNGRLDTLQAAILLKRLPQLAQLIEKRHKVAQIYEARLANWVDIPREAAGEYDTFYTYTIRVGERDALQAYLTEKGIETKIRHLYLMPDQPAYQHNAQGDWPNAKRLIKNILCLPIHEKLSRADVEFVAASVEEFYQNRGKD